MEETVKQVQGEPWKNERYFASFEEADTFRKAVKAQDKTGTYQVKVKRCGVAGTMYVVKAEGSSVKWFAKLEEAEKFYNEIIANPEILKQVITCNPRDYKAKEEREGELNEYRTMANLKAVPLYEEDTYIKDLKAIARI